MFKFLKYIITKKYILGLDELNLKSLYYHKYNVIYKSFKIILNFVFKNLNDILKLKLQNNNKNHFSTLNFIKNNEESSLEKYKFIKIFIRWIKRKYLKLKLKMHTRINFELLRFIDLKKYLKLKILLKNNKKLYKSVFYKSIEEQDNIYYLKKYNFISYIFKIYSIIPKIFNLFFFRKKYDFENLNTIKEYYIPEQEFEIKNIKSNKLQFLKNFYMEYLYRQSQRLYSEIISERIQRIFYFRLLILLSAVMYFFLFFNRQVIYEKIWTLYLKEPALEILYELIPEIPKIQNYLPDWAKYNIFTEIYKKFLIFNLSLKYFKLTDLNFIFIFIFQNNIDNINEIVETYFILNINLLDKIEKYLNIKDFIFENLPLIEYKIIILIYFTFLFCSLYIEFLKLIDRFLNYLINKIIYIIKYLKKIHFNKLWIILTTSFFFIFGFIYPLYRDFKIYFLHKTKIFNHLSQMINYIITLLILFKTFCFKYYVLKQYKLFFYKNIYFKYIELFFYFLIYINIFLILCYLVQIYILYLNIVKFNYLLYLYENICVLTNIYSYHFQRYNYYFSILLILYLIISLIEFKIYNFKNLILKKFFTFTIIYWILIFLPYYIEILTSLIISNFFFKKIFIKLFNFLFKEFSSLKNFNLLYILFNWNFFLLVNINIIFVSIYYVLNVFNLSIINLIIFLFLVINCIFIRIQIKLGYELNLYFKILHQQKLLKIKSMKNITITKNFKNIHIFIYLFLFLHSYYFFKNANFYFYELFFSILNF
jgi:hypothetical protein